MDEHHSVSVEKVEGGHLVTESHHSNGEHTVTRRFEAGRRPSRDTAALVAQGPKDGKDAAGSTGLAGAKRLLGNHV